MGPSRRDSAVIDDLSAYLEADADCAVNELRVVLEGRIESPDIVVGHRHRDDSRVKKWKGQPRPIRRKRYDVYIRLDTFGPGGEIASAVFGDSPRSPEVHLNHGARSAQGAACRPTRSTLGNSRYFPPAPDKPSTEIHKERLRPTLRGLREQCVRNDHSRQGAAV